MVLWHLGEEISLEGLTGMEPHVRMALKEAIVEAVKSVGLDCVKRTSLFLSNEIAVRDFKQAA